MRSKFVFPAFRKGQEVRTPDGVGRITSIDNTTVGYMYCVNGRFYHQEEIKAV